MNLVGLRVVRGPDWDHGDIDGGNGYLGTLVNICPNKTAQVVWDNGQQCNCRILENGPHDLKIYDSGPVGINHIRYTCSTCRQKVIFGMRWQCQLCNDVSLCPVCYVTNEHNINHPFIRYDTPQLQGVNIPERCGSISCPTMGIFPGATVNRGRDWMQNDLNGGNGATGKVLSINNDEESLTVRNMVCVKWSVTDQTDQTCFYRLGGISGKVDLMFKVASNGLPYYPDHFPDCGK
ncbi:hypothetical protein LOTGIDRAFT_76249, partial [Lottia gigantea]